MSSSIHPGIFLIFAGIITAAVPKKVRRVLLVLCPAAALLAALCIPVGIQLVFSFAGNYNFVYLQLTQQNYIFLVVFAMTALVNGIYAAQNDSRLEAFASMGYAGSALGVTLAGDWLTLLLFWELMAVTSLFLIWGQKRKEATAAGFRYILMHMFGGSLLLFGIALETAKGNYLIANLTAGPHDAAFWLIFAGVAVNAAFVPLHAWVPDAYPQSSVTGGNYLCAFTTKVAILCLARVFAGFDFLLIAGLIMIFYGAIFALMENDMRRLLSYHIISQLGYMVTDLSFQGTTAVSAAGALAAGNVIYKSLLFMCAGAVMYATGKRKISELGGLARKMPLTCVVFFIAAFSIAGAPPFAGFTLKSLSILTAQEAGNHLVVWLMVAGNILTVMSIAFKMGYFVFFGKERADVEVGRVPLNMKIAMLIGAANCIWIGFLPQFVYRRFMPYPVDYHPYHLGHILEYVMLITSVLIAFLMYLDKMAPHDTITLDVDWFLRRPFKRAVYAISWGVCALQYICANLGRELYHWIQVITHHPYKILRRKPFGGVDEKVSGTDYQGDAYRIIIGDGMLQILIVVIILALVIIIEHLT